MTTTVLNFRNAPKCYACDAVAVGGRDRRPEGGKLELACERHAQHGIRMVNACMYCNGPMRRGGLDVDGDNAHANCHRDASA